MGITYELRHEVANYPFRDNRDFALFEAIADRIDIAHKHAIGYVDDRDPETMAENGWVKLPVDADGEIIHVGDMMETERFGVVEVEGFIHNAIAFNVYDPQPARICTVPANQCRHHHAPTVEDVLTEFSVRVLNSGHQWGLDGTEVIAEYAAKLRLADDGKGQ